MLTHELVGITNVAAAIACAVIAVVTWRRRALNQSFAVALTFVMAGGCWWSVALAVVVAAPSPTAVAIATLVTFPGPSILVTAFMCLGLTIAQPQWVPRRWMIVALLVEPVLITTAGATNPWHLLVYRGPGAARLATPTDWTYGPVFWLDSAYGYLVVAVGLALVGWGWWGGGPGLRPPPRCPAGPPAQPTGRRFRAGRAASVPVCDRNDHPTPRALRRRGGNVTVW